MDCDGLSQSSHLDFKTTLKPMILSHSCEIENSAQSGKRHVKNWALTAPSGANQQPWTFVVVEDSAVRKRLRETAEEEERQFYDHRAPQAWLDALSPFGTDASKSFLETAPVIIAIYAQSWKALPNVDRGKHYYVAESVGIATGFFIIALHNAGLATLTHTPSPMNFLNQILGRPDNERPYLILVAGYPSDGCQMPIIQKKTFDDVVIRV